jgi:hypothetical protein
MLRLDFHKINTKLNGPNGLVCDRCGKDITGLGSTCHILCALEAALADEPYTTSLAPKEGTSHRKDPQ